MRTVLLHTARHFARAIVMPNLKPPVVTTRMALAYRDRILAAVPPGSRFEPLMTLYLTDATSPAEILEAKKSQGIHGVKYYPAGATTNKMPMVWMDPLENTSTIAPRYTPADNPSRLGCTAIRRDPGARAALTG